MFGSTKLLEQRIAGLEEEVADLKEANKALDSVVGVLLKGANAAKFNSGVDNSSDSCKQFWEIKTFRKAIETRISFTIAMEMGMAESTYNIHLKRAMDEIFLYLMNHNRAALEGQYLSADDFDAFILDQLKSFSFSTVYHRISALKSLFEYYDSTKLYPALESNIKFDYSNKKVYGLHGKHPELGSPNMLF